MRRRTFQKPLAVILSIALVLGLVPTPALAEALASDAVDALEVADEQAPVEEEAEHQEPDLVEEPMQDEAAPAEDQPAAPADEQPVPPADEQPAAPADEQPSDGMPLDAQEDSAGLMPQYLDDGEIGLMDSIGITGNLILNDNERYTIVGGPTGWKNTSSTVIFTPTSGGTRPGHEGAYAVVTDAKDHTVLNGLTYEEDGKYWSLPEGSYTMTFDVNGTPYTTDDVYEVNQVVLFNSYYGTAHADDFVVKDNETGDRLTTVDTAKDVKLDFVIDAATWMAAEEGGAGPRLVSITLLKTDASAETLAQQMAAGDFSTWPSQTTWDDLLNGVGLKDEVTIYPVTDYSHEYRIRYQTTPPDKHAEASMGSITFGYAVDHPWIGQPDNYEELTSGQYFPVVRYVIGNEDYIYAYNPITIEATQPTDAKAPSITTTTLPSVMANDTYSEILEGKTGSPDGEAGQMSWSITEGTLPEGLVLDGDTGAIKGIPVTPGAYPFTVTLTEVIDGESRSASRNLSIRVLDEVALGEIYYDQDPIWSDGTQHSVFVSAPVLIDLSDPDYNLSGTKAWAIIHQSKDGVPLQDIWQPLTLSGGEASGNATVQADATAISSIEVKLELRNNNGKIIYRSTPDGGREPFEVISKVDNPNIPFGGQVVFPKLDLESTDTPIVSARVRVWPANEEPTESNTYSDYINIGGGCDFPLVEGSYVFVIEASVGQADGWVDIMGSSEMGKLVAGTSPKQYQFSVVRGKTTTIDATFSAEKIAYHNASVLFENEYGEYESGLCPRYSVEWYRRSGGKDVLVGTGDTVVLEQTGDPLYVKAIPEGSYAAMWDALPLVRVSGKVATLKVPRKPHFSVKATLAFASGWDDSNAWRLGVIEIAKPCGNGEYTTENVWVYENPITLDDITPGTVLTYTPVDESMCGPVSYTIKNAKNNKVTLTAPHARGIVTFEDLTLLKADDLNSRSDDNPSARTEDVALNYWGTKVEVTKGAGDAEKPVKFYIADESRLRILDDEASLVAGTQYNITVTVSDYNGTHYPFCSTNDGYAARKTFVATLADNGDYLASATIANDQLVSRGACAMNFVKRSGNYVDLFLYDESGDLVRNSWWYGDGESKSRSPFLPAGNYKLYAVDSKAIGYDRYDDAKTVAGLVEAVGTDERVVKKIDFTINDNELGALSNDFVMPVGAGEGLIDASKSMVTAEGNYGDSMTIRMHAESDVKDLIKDDAYIEIYTNQPSGISEDGYTNPQALSINGKAIAINRWNNLFGGTQKMQNGTLRVLLSEAKKYSEACGELPMDMTLVIPRVNTDKTEVWAWLVSDGHRSLIGYYDEVAEDISLTAPITVAWKTFAVHGMARLNADVDICIDGMRVAQSKADEYGFFTTEVTLPDDVEDGDEFAMTATSTWTQGGSERTATSEAQDVTYSTTEPAVERITMFYQDSVGGSYHAVKLYDRGALSSKYLGIYRPGYEDASNQMHYVFMAEIVNPKLATDVKINVVRSDGDLELEARSDRSSIASAIPDVQKTLDLRNGLQGMASYTGGVQRNAAGDIIVDALDRGTAFVTDPVILSYAPEEVYVTFDDVLDSPQTIDSPEAFLGFKSAGVTEEGLSGALTAINTSDHLKIVNAADDANGNMTLVDPASAAKQYLSKPDGSVDEWLAINLGGDDGWLKVHHTTNITDAPSSEATSAISKAKKANDAYVKQIDGKKLPSVTYEGKSVTAVCLGHDNDPTNVYFVETLDGAGANIDMMYQYSIGSTGRSLYTRIVADRSMCTRTDWDESTGKRTTMTFAIDASQLPNAMNYYDMSVMWQYILGTMTMGYEDAAASLGMDAEETEELLGLTPQGVVGEVAKSKTVKQKVWELLGYSTELDGMSDEEINFIKDYISAVGDKSAAADDKSLWNWYDERESKGKPNTLKQLKSAWGTSMFKKLTEIAVSPQTSMPGKKDMIKAALENLQKAAKARGKGSKEYSPAFRRTYNKLRNEIKQAHKEGKGKDVPDLPPLPPEKPKKPTTPKKPKTPSMPTVKPKPKNKNPQRGKNSNATTAKRNSGKGAKIKWDPSGIVYEAVLSNPVEGAQVQLFTYNTAGKNAVFLDSTKFGVEPNPQTTDAEGHYQWFVPEGWWQVRASKEGYDSFSTGNANTGAKYGINATRDLDGDGIDDTTEYWMPVLPIQLDVNLPLVSHEKPTVKAVEGDETGVTVEFSKHMKPETVVASLFTVAGNAPSKVEALDAEEAGDGSGAVYARRFKLVYASDVSLKVGENTVKVTMADKSGKARSYAGSVVDGLPYSGSVKVTISQKTQEMYRLYNPNSGEHFYTADEAERDHLVKVGWRYEGVGWTAPAKSQTPVHRLYNPVAGEHHYTSDLDEKDMLVRAGWRYEGVGWYSDDAKSVPLYRQYNPNAFACNHNYTTDKKENDHLVSLGWRYEGIGWYGVKQ